MAEINLKPILKNELVLLRPLREEDLEALYQVAKDPKIWEQHPCKRNNRDEFEKFFKESINSKGALIIEDAKTNIVIGSSRYKTIANFSNGVEIGWTFLSRNYWGGTYNKAVKQLMTTHVFKVLDAVIHYIDKGNIRSQMAVKKLGRVLINTTEYPKLRETNTNNLTFIVKKQHPSSGLQ